MKFLQSPLFAAVLGGVLFLLTSAFLTTQGVATATHADEEPATHPNLKGASWDFFNPELDQIVADLKTERDTLATREKQLNELATRLKAERAGLDDALKSIKKIQEQVDKNLFRIQSQEEPNLKKLAKMYTAMEPASAARIMRELDDTIVVKILTLVKEPETALILESLSRMGEAETRRAAAISECLRSAVSTKPSSNK
jgi:flagellar motility protein MotE (MotC chaperone)